MDETRVEAVVKTAVAATDAFNDRSLHMLTRRLRVEHARSDRDFSSEHVKAKRYEPIDWALSVT